jgi:hypothetical protein
MFYYLELIGIAAFAISGVMAARSKRPDIIGAVIIAFVTALCATIVTLLIRLAAIMKIKVNSGYVLLIIIAVIFAFGPLWFSLQKKASFQEVSRQWIDVKLPGKLTEMSIPGQADLKFIASNDNYRSAIIALLPAPEKSEMEKSLKGGEIEVLAFINKVILNNTLLDAHCLFDNKTNVYRLSGIRSSDKWFASGLVWKVSDKPNAALLVVFSDTDKDSRKIMEKIHKSINLK